MNAFKCYIFLVPVPLTVLSFYLWRTMTENLCFSVFAIVLPMAYGYIMPGIATGILKKWRFQGRFTFAGIYFHHGFLYASKLSLILFVCSYGMAPPEPLGHLKQFSIMATASMAFAFIAWITDIYLLKAEMVVINSPAAKSGKSPEEVTFKYAPLSFFFIGLTYSADVLLAYEKFLVQNKTDPFTFIWVFAVGFILMFALPSLAYRINDH